MPTYDFSNKVAFVTGAARGQGRSHAQHYAKHGADVVVSDINENMESVPFDLGTAEELDETASLVESEGQRALAVTCDVSREDHVKSAVSEAIHDLGKIDILAHNAGIGSFSDLNKMNERQWDEMIDVNLKGVWLTSKHVGQHFIDRGDGGKIVSTSSAAGLVAQPGNGHYVAAKHGVIGLTKTLALELAEYNVNVNTVCPTVVNTPMIDGFMEAYGEETFAEMAGIGGPMNVFNPEDPGVEASDISEAYMWLSSDAARYVTGIALPVEAGLTAK